MLLLEGGDLRLQAVDDGILNYCAMDEELWMESRSAMSFFAGMLRVGLVKKNGAIQGSSPLFFCSLRPQLEGIGAEEQVGCPRARD